MISVRLSTILVADQDHALDFYTEKLGFQKKTDLPAGEFRWLTVVSPADPDGVELTLEPNTYPAAAAYQKALHEAGIPLNALAVDDLKKEYARLKELGVQFKTGITEVEGWPAHAVFDDTCGNLIQIYEDKSA